MNSSPLIVASVLSDRLGDAGLRVLDCRFDLMNPAAGRDEWRSEHIPAAAYADLDRDLAGPLTAQSGRHPLPHEQTLCDTFGRLGIGSGDSVVVYDAGSGAIAARAWWLLQWLGHEDAALLDGGFAAWKAAGFATERGEPDVPRREFAGRAQDDFVLTTDDVVTERRVRRGCLFDARDAVRFRGELEPIDRVAGHIPGTRNIPFATSLLADGHWKSTEELRAVWSENAGTTAEGDWGVMCGSGVTACHLALSACLAGLRMPALYVGSWSEWIADTTRPVASGDSELSDAQNAAEPA